MSEKVYCKDCVYCVVDKDTFEIYLCPKCGKTIKHSYPTHCLPLYDCFHDDGVYRMYKIFNG
jgi:ribosomal protein L37AE/L43A